MFSDIRHIFNLTFRLYGTCFVSSSCFVAMFSNKLHNNETKSLEKGIIFLAHQWKMKHNDLALSSQEHCNDHCLTQADTSTREKFDFTARSFPQLRLHLTCSFHTTAFTHLKLISTHQGLRVDSHSRLPSCFFRFSPWPASGCGKLLRDNLPEKSPANTDSHISRFLRCASITVCLCASVGSCTRPFHTYYSSQTLSPLKSSFPISQ